MLFGGWFKCFTINGGEHNTRYRTLLKFGRLRLHIFHRGDLDPDPHDHPWPFWTFPLTSYTEEVFEPSTCRTHINVVQKWRWHWRPASYAHRVLGRYIGVGNIVTIVITGNERRQPWGFWKRVGDGANWLPAGQYQRGE